jgi:hypothetical protein
LKKVNGTVTKVPFDVNMEGKDDPGESHRGQWPVAGCRTPYLVADCQLATGHWRLSPAVLRAGPREGHGSRAKANGKATVSERAVDFLFRLPWAPIADMIPDFESGDRRENGRATEEEYFP